TIMTKKSPLFITVLMVLSVLLGSCAEKQHILSGNEIKFDTLSISDSLQLRVDSISAKCKVNISMLYPSSCGEKYDLKKLRELFIDAMVVHEGGFNNPEMAIEFYRDSCYNDFRVQMDDLAKNLPDFKEDPPAFITGFFHQKDISVPFNKENILTIKSSIYDYTGGAHGYGADMYSNYDLDGMKKITLSSIFDESTYPQIADVIVSQLVKDYNVKSAQELEETGFFNVKQIAPTENFCFEDSAIMFSYTRYDIAPYSMGQINVSVPYTDLKPFFKPNSIIERLSSGK
ncbi:MAG: DUF3298 domain-containing protein, partial [Bacteroidales bacterium]